METLYEKIMWNITLFLLSLILGVLLIQHGSFFYTYPPDFSKVIFVPIQVYFILGIVIFLGFKITHYAAESGEIVPDTESK
jgi:hypothetical protein